MFGFIKKFFLNKRLIRAAEQNDVEEMRSLLQKGADINTRGFKDRVTPLMAAIIKGRKEAAEFLIKNGADVNMPNKSGLTPLMACAITMPVNMMHLLLEKGADVNARDCEGNTPLVAAALDKQGDGCEKIQLLLQNGANVNAQNNKEETPLITILKIHHPKTALKLINALIDKADINYATSQGLTALSVAATRQNTDVIRFLIEKGADVNAQNSRINPLIRAILFNTVDVVDFLAKNGADVNHYNPKTDTTPLLLAALYKPEAVQILLKNGADLDFVYSKGETIISRLKNAHGFDSETHTPILKLLKEEAQRREASKKAAFLAEEMARREKTLKSRFGDEKTWNNINTALNKVLENGAGEITIKVADQKVKITSILPQEHVR